MPKYLLTFNYSVEGAKGLKAGGGTAREAAVKHSVESLGGKMEAFYFAFGEKDAVVLVDLPDNVSAVAAAVTVTGSGAGEPSTTPLITAKEMDAACKKAVAYKPPKA